MSKLTEKNKQAIEVYLGAGSPEAKGNGTKSWQEVYGTKSENTAAMAWSRMIRKDKSKEYLDARRQEIEEEVTQKVSDRISYEIEDAVRDLLKIQQSAMQMVGRGKVARKVKSKSETGEEVEEVEYCDVEGMLDPGEATRATVEAVKVQGKYITKSEGVNTTVTPEDRQLAGAYGLSLTEYVKRKEDGTLGARPEIPKRTH